MVNCVPFTVTQDPVFILVLFSTIGFLTLVLRIFMRCVMFGYLRISEFFCFLATISDYWGRPIGVQKCALENFQCFS